MNLAVSSTPVLHPAVARGSHASHVRGWQEPLLRLLDVMEARSPAMRSHADRVENCSLQVGAGLGISGHRLVLLQIAALLHDIGKIGLPAPIRDKAGRFSPQEFVIMKTHSRRGETILQEMGFPAEAARFVRCHHEQFDGNGYPDGLQGDEIPLEAKILAVADAYVALTEDRPCRPALSYRTATDWVATLSGIRFDPEVVQIFLHARRA